MSDDRELVALLREEIEFQADWFRRNPTTDPFAAYPGCPGLLERAADRIEAIGNTRITPGSDLRDALEKVAAAEKACPVNKGDWRNKTCPKCHATDRETCWPVASAESKVVRTLRAALTKDDLGGGQTEEDRANPASQDRAGAPSGLSPSVSSKAAHRISQGEKE